MNNELERRIKKAENLRKKKSFPISLFSSPDYFESAEMFYEIAKDLEDVELKEKYLIEAANTFALLKGEYTLYKSAECYKKLFDILLNVNLEKAISYYATYSSYVEKMGKNLIAGQAYTKIGDLLAKSNKHEALEYYKKSIKVYKSDPSTPYHLKEAYTRLLLVQLDLEDLEGAVDTLGNINIDHAKLCKQILLLLLEKPVTESDDALAKQESQLIMSIINKDRLDAIEDLNVFKNNNFLSEPIKKIFDIAIQRLSPENDIC